MALFENQAEDDVERALGLVEETIRSLGVDPEQARMDPDKGPRFVLRRGSASIIVAIHPPQDGGAGTLRVVAPVIQLPDGDRTALYEVLLKANVTELRGVAFGISGADVVVVSERGVRDLDASEVEAMVKSVGRAADRFDDKLAEQFGTARSSDG